MISKKCKSSNNYANSTNSCKYKKQWNSYTFSFMFRPYGANVFKVCFLLFSLWRGLVGSVFLNKCYSDVMKKTTMLTITKMLVQMFLLAWYAMRMFTRVGSVIIPPITNSVNCFNYILFSTFVTSKEINQKCFHAIKLMINFVSFSCNRTGKTARLINICANVAKWSFTVKRPYWPFTWI